MAKDQDASQPRIFDYIMSEGYITRSKSKSNEDSDSSSAHDPPQRQSSKKSNKIRKSESKKKRQRRNRQDKMNASRHLSGDSIHSISSNTSCDSSSEAKSSSSATSPTDSRTVSQMLGSVYDNAAPSSSPQTSQAGNPTEEVEKLRVYAEYLESENRSIKLQRDLLHTDLETAQKTITSLRKTNKKLTAQNDKFTREASKRSGMRRHTDLQNVATDTDPPPAEKSNTPAALQEATNIAIAQYNSICDQMAKAAKHLLDSVSNAKVQIPSPPSPLNSNVDPNLTDQGFETVTSRNTRRRQAQPPPPNAQQIPVLSSAVPGNHVQVHNIPVPTYAEAMSTTATRQHRQPRPGQGARQRKKLIILGTSLTDGLSAELKAHDINSTTHIYRGGKLDLIRERIPFLFSKDVTKQPDDVLLLAGGNDAEETSIDRTINEYEGLIRDLRTACPTTRIIVSSIPPRKNDRAINHRIKEVNDYLRDRGLRGDNVKFVDAAPVASSMFTRKLVHFNSEGKREFAKRFQSFLAN